MRRRRRTFPLCLRVRTGSGRLGWSLTGPLLLALAVAVSGSWLFSDARSLAASSTPPSAFGDVQPVTAVWSALSPLPALTDGQTGVSTFASAGVARVTRTPRITRLTPTRGKRTAKVTITGKRFGKKRGRSSVKFGKYKVTRYVRWSATRIVCRVPAKAAIGKVLVRVRTSKGASNAKPFTVTGAASTLPGTLYQETDPRLRFLGAWTSVGNSSCSGGTQKSVNGPGAVIIDFTGTQVYVVASKGPAYGVLKVTLDGVAQPGADLYAAVAAYRQTVFSKTGLPDAAHRLVVEWSNSRNPAASGTTVDVDAVSVVGSLSQAPELTGGLVGFWATTPEWSWAESYTFRADGSYTYLLEGRLGSTYGLLRQEGLYAAYQGQGTMRLYLFGRLERFTPSGGPDGAWESLSSGEWSYRIINYTNGAKLNIDNGWGADYWLR